MAHIPGSGVRARRKGITRPIHPLHKVQVDILAVPIPAPNIRQRAIQPQVTHSHRNKWAMVCQ